MSEVLTNVMLGEKTWVEFGPNVLSKVNERFGVLPETVYMLTDWPSSLTRTEPVLVGGALNTRIST